MSVIAVKVTPEAIHVASDSILVKDDLKRTNFQKVRCHNHMIVGGCGSAEELSLFFEFTKEHRPAALGTESIVHLMSQFNEYKERVMQESGIDNTYVIVYKDRAWEIQGFFVQEIFDYTAFGDGETYALAALYLGHSVQEAVDAACEFCTNVSAPIKHYKMECGKTFGPLYNT